MLVVCSPPPKRSRDGLVMTFHPSFPLPSRNLEMRVVKEENEGRNKKFRDEEKGGAREVKRLICGRVFEKLEKKKTGLMMKKSLIVFKYIRHAEGGR